jgi:hypothetical protein
MWMHEMTHTTQVSPRNQHQVFMHACDINHVATYEARKVSFT